MMTSHTTVLCEVRQRTSDGNYREKKSCIVEQAQVKNGEAITCVYHKEVVRKGREQHESSVTMVREVKMDKGRKQVQEAYRKEVRGPAQQAERSESPKRESTTNTLKDKNITSGNQMADRRTVTLETRACTFSLTACSWVFPIVVIVLFATTMAIIYIMADAFMAKNR